MSKILRFAFTVALYLPMALPQSTGLGRISGTVTDSSGLAVADVNITITNTGTGDVRKTSANNSGVYVVSPLPLGNYSLEAHKDGFKSAVQRNLRIDVNSSLTVDLVLEVGSVSESVTVQDRPVAIETENATVGNSRYEVQLKNLPVIVREIQTLVGQTAGVPAGSTDVVGGTFNQGGRSAMQVSADGAGVAPFQTTGWPAIDGIDRRADLNIPSIDAIAEVRFTSSGGNAEYFQPTQVIVASKAGTNEYHGGAFEFYRSGGMGARRWEAPARTSFVRHQFGGTLGGAIKKDKTFFFASADMFRHTAGLIQNVRYPTAAERSGNLSSYLLRTDAQGRPAPVTPLDPLNGNQPFAGNVIPGSRLNPVSLELLKSIPDAPQPGRVADFNAAYFKPQIDNSEKYDLRVDHNFTQNDKIFAKTTIAHLDQASRYEGQVPGAMGASKKNQWNEVVSANYTRIISPTTIAVFQVTYRNMPFKNIPSLGDSKFPVAIRDLNPESPFAGPPAIAVGSNAVGIGNLFDRLLFNYSADYNYTIDPTITKTIANHTVKAGFTYLWGVKTTELASPPYGRFTTSSDFNNARSTTSATGDAFADFLLGYPNSTDVTIGERGGYHDKKNWSFFLQDDWKVTQRLTLNFGLRYDNFGFFREYNKRAAVGDFVTGKIIIPDGSSGLIHPVFKQFSDRYIEASAAGVPNTFIRPNNWDFVPRLGAAYRLRSDLVLRGGFGVYNVDYTINEFRNSINVAPFIRRAQLTRPLLISQNVDVNSIFTFTNPTANSSAAGADTQLTTLDGFAPDYPMQKTYSWNLTVEKDFARRLGVRLTYAGNIGRSLSRTVRVNSCAPGPTECLARAANDPTGRKWTNFSINMGQRAGDGTSNY
ncbi:MAG: TonB-dependent receptor, partial [Acidobacteriota bacterium]